ncbi:thioredoxin family protein [Alphaproteobacteria bacterium]|nr:thioredoxin family protein [Alphaproteobacteria bacterium]
MPVNAPNEQLDWTAPNFNLLSVDNNRYSLNSIAGKKGTVIVFICNHCPYVISIADRLSLEAIQLKKIGVNTAAIMSNDILTYPEDSFENMQKFSSKYSFKFPYLFDNTQEVAKKFNAVCTPDFFGFNNNLKLQYRGRIDSKIMNKSDKCIKRELFYAMEIISRTGIGPLKQYNSFGCSIKWKKDE